MVRTEVVVLFEHVSKSGMSMPCTSNEPNLVNKGWNDRASSVMTWGAIGPDVGIAIYCGPYYV
jgi:hypothetical protein